MFLPLKKKKFTTFSFEIHKVESRAVPSPHPPFNFRETCPITVILHTQKQTRVSQCVSVYVQNPDSSKKENKNTDRIVKLRGPSSKHTHTHTQILDPTKNRTFPFLNRPPALAIQTLSLSLSKTLFSFFQFNIIAHLLLLLLLSLQFPLRFVPRSHDAVSLSLQVFHSPFSTFSLLA